MSSKVLAAKTSKFQALGYSVVLEADGVGQGGGWHELLNSAIYIFDNSENSLFRQNYGGGEEVKQERECQSGD